MLDNTCSILTTNNLFLSDGCGLRLEPQLKPKAVNSVNLLVVAESNTDVNLIIKYLETAKVVFSYEVARQGEAELFLSQKNYDLVLFSYYPCQETNEREFFRERVGWWHKRKEEIPLIVIAQSWQEQIAADCLEMGISGYVSKSTLVRLPETLNRSLLNFRQKQDQQARLAELQQQIARQRKIDLFLRSIRETYVVSEILKITANTLHKTFTVNRCLIVQLDSENYFRVKYTSQATPEKQELINLVCPLFNYYRPSIVAGKCLVRLAGDRDLPAPVREMLARSKIRSLAIVPLMARESCLGGICLHHTEVEHQWTKNELELLETIARECAIAIDRAQLIQQMQQQQQREQILDRISKTLNSCREPEQILQEIIRQVGESFEVERTLLFRLEREKIKIEREWRKSETIPSLLNNKIFLSEWPELFDPNYDRQKYRLFAAPNYEAYTKLYRKKLIKQKVAQLQAVSCLNIPIFIRQKLFGGLTLHAIEKNRTFTPEEIAALGRIAEQTALAIDKAQNYQLLETEYSKQAEKLEREKHNFEENNNKRAEFLSHLTHEMRTPLTAILGFSRMLSDRIYGPLNPTQMKYVKAISESGDHMLSLINDFLDLSKIEAEREELVLEKIAVEDVCLASMSMVEEQARQEGLELILEIDPRISFCMADRQRIKQILVNLLSNAVKFTERGSITLKVQPNGQMLEFLAIDTGIGLSAEAQNKLFEPFTQIRTHLHRKYKGTGLGLALSRQLARLHGGDLSVTSEEGKGSCFKLTIPI